MTYANDLWTVTIHFMCKENLSPLDAAGVVAVLKPNGPRSVHKGLKVQMTALHSARMWRAFVRLCVCRRLWHESHSPHLSPRLLAMPTTSYQVVSREA